jgi:hypothetical protein
MNERKVTGTEDTVAAGLSRERAFPASSPDAGRFPSALLALGAARSSIPSGARIASPPCASQVAERAASVLEAFM